MIWAGYPVRCNFCGSDKQLHSCDEEIEQLNIKNNTAANKDEEVLLRFLLVKTTKRLTFDVVYQHPRTIYNGPDDGPYFLFTASNKYQVISRSRSDIQTERLWLLGAKHETDPRSGTMVFSDDAKRDKAHDEFIIALLEWANENKGMIVKLKP